MQKKRPPNAEATQFVSGDRAVENGRRGGVASAAKKREKKTMAQMAALMLESTLSDKSRAAIRGVCPDVEEDQMTVQSAMVAGQIKAAINGNVSAFEALTALADREQQRLDQQAMEDAARRAAEYHTDLHYIADVFHPLIRDIRNKGHREYVLPGGRGSTKSTVVFMILEELIKNNPNMHALVLRQVGNTLRDSVYAQMQWAVNQHATNPLFSPEEWHFKVSPMEVTYLPTGQKIYFRGADDPGKLKSIKPPFGHIGILVFEELDQFGGDEAVRKIEQSAIRGGDEAYIFKIFNPPISRSNWANKYAETPKSGMVVHKSSYLDVPPEWLGRPFIEEAEHLRAVNPDAYAHEYLGEPVGLGTEIFRHLEIRTITDDEIARQERIYQGQDWGWDPDPKAFIRASYNHATETILLIDEMGGNCIRTRDMAQMIIDRGYNDFEIYCGVDEIEHINDYKDMGLPARRAIVTPGSVRRTHEWLQCRRIVIDPARTPRAYKEFTEYEHDIDRNGEVIDGYPDRNNHYIDALRYATSPLSMRRGEKA
jgi:PBSX family phage terminase large subunit